MHTAQMIDTLEVAQTFLGSLGGDGLTDPFFPAPSEIEIGTKDGHPQVHLHYHMSDLLDPDRGVIVGALSRLEAVEWGTGTVPFGKAWVSTGEDEVEIHIDVYVPCAESRGPRLTEALLFAGWANVVGVG